MIISTRGRPNDPVVVECQYVNWWAVGKITQAVIFSFINWDTQWDLVFFLDFLGEYQAIELY